MDASESPITAQNVLLEILNVDTASPPDSLAEGVKGRANFAP
jgi:hypothetical protein